MAAGFTPLFVPVLDFTYCNQPALSAWLLDAPSSTTGTATTSSLAGVILTSQRAAQALGEAIRQLERLETWTPRVRQYWSQMPFYAVGEATASVLQSLGLSCVGKEAGSAGDLANVVLSASQGRAARQYLFLCGDNRRPTLPDRLAAERVPLTELVVYSSSSDKGRFESSLRAALRAVCERAQCSLDDFLSHSLRWIVFFSPSGVDTALPALQKLYGECARASWGGAAIAAIGPTTAEHLQSDRHGQKVSAVAESPSARGLCEAVQRKCQ